MIQENKRWIRVASLYPERGQLHQVLPATASCWISPMTNLFYPKYETTWIQRPVHIKAKDETFTARIVQTDGEVVEKQVNV